jgi:hypothetical protein
MKISGAPRSFALALLFAAAVVFGGAGGSLLGLCGPFTDVAADSFCPFVLELFTLGITTGTSPTTYDPTSAVNRLQMAAFLSRTVDGVLKRGSRRAANDQFWTTQNALALGVTTVGSAPAYPRSDGADIWVPNLSGTVSRVRASDGQLLETWTGATSAGWITIAMGRVAVTAFANPGKLYVIDPSQTAGAVTTVATNVGAFPGATAFDGARFWTSNSPPGSGVSIVTPAASPPWTVTTVTSGFGGTNGILFDGANVWATEFGTPGKLVKLDAAGAILLTVTVGSAPAFPVYDGAIFWVPNNGSPSVTVVRASSGAVLQTLTGNGLAGPLAAAFDGQRVLITNGISNNQVSLWKAADLTPIGAFSTGAATGPQGACSDGLNFWITLNVPGKLARF